MDLQELCLAVEQGKGKSEKGQRISQSGDR